MGAAMFLLIVVAFAGAAAYAGGYRISKGRVEGEDTADSPTLTEIGDPSLADPLAPRTPEETKSTAIDMGNGMLQMAEGLGCSQDVVDALATTFLEDVDTMGPEEAVTKLSRELTASCGLSTDDTAAVPPPPEFDATSPGLPPLFPNQVPPAETPTSIRTDEDLIKEAALMVTRATMKCGFQATPDVLAAQAAFQEEIASGLDVNSAFSGLRKSIESICPEAV